MKDKLRQINAIAFMEVKKLFRSPKIYLLIFFSFYFIQEYANNIKMIAMANSAAVTPYFYPIFCNDWMNSVYIFLMIIVLMSDAPFYDNNKYFVLGRSGSSIWIIGKILYIVVISIIYQLINVVLSIVVFFPYIGLSGKWGDVIEYYASGIDSNSLTVNGDSNIAQLVDTYKPLSALLCSFCIVVLIA